jgi:hypothetical protein
LEDLRRTVRECMAKLDVEFHEMNFS